jgi:flagellar protein FlgJ
MENKPMTPKEFVHSYYPYAVETQDKTGIDARFILAQAALETGWGKSAPGNMFFGVKAGPGTTESKRQLLRTREVLLVDGAKFPEVISIAKRKDGKYDYVVKDWFRKYDSPEESFTDHAKFFFENKRYKDALRVKYDPYKFAEAIARAGYATDPNYATSLKGVIKTIEKNLPKETK